ncbi:hypothetical protein MXB_1682 [Myxobolus squamalis]|nr:hypothetical protein MXB_1682 [Myxobolus squamalis]
MKNQMQLFFLLDIINFVGLNCEILMKVTKLDDIGQCWNVTEDQRICSIDEKCLMGESYTTGCFVPDDINCSGPRKFPVNYICAYCFQLPPERLTCTPTCKHECSPNPGVLCMGVDQFYLGNIKSGFAKIYTSGGLGVWNLWDLFKIYYEFI